METQETYTKTDALISALKFLLRCLDGEIENEHKNNIPSDERGKLEWGIKEVINREPILLPCYDFLQRPPYSFKPPYSPEEE